MSASYAEFLARKRAHSQTLGIAVDSLPSALFPWQAAIVRWALRRGRAAIFADCGLGKTVMQLAWAAATGERALILAPLCVAEQTVVEASTKLGLDVRYARSMDEAGNAPIVITNYERLDAFDLSGFGAVVLDESSILKAFDGKTRTRLIASCANVRFRLCCTATPSPNDIAELANHAEFLGVMTRPEFLANWFVHDDAGWRMKGHAIQPFYRWLATWAVALRAPSDIGYPNDGFELPKLTIRDRVIATDGLVGDSLFPEMAAKGLGGRLAARRGSIIQRIEATADLIAGQEHAHRECQWLLWCGLNDEADALSKAIPGAVNVQGADDYGQKAAAVRGFASGEIRVLVSKAKILGYGLNFQSCHHMAFVGLGDSYESYYQCIRRAWRFGQRHPVDVHIVVSDAERAIVESVRRKETAAASLADGLIAHMRDFEREELAS
jgi:hypothetical protein